MTDFLSGKRALVTGASKGIGLEITRALIRAGSHVVICGRDAKKLDSALSAFSDNGRTWAKAADVSKSEDVAELFQFVRQQMGGLDILVNNAGVGIFRATAELSVAEWNRVIGTNLSGAFYCTREALELFQSNKNGGSIINISSLAGKNPFAGGAAYNASKFGLKALSEAAILDHRFDRVRVSYILPGSVDTEFSGRTAEKKSDWKIAPEDIAEIVLQILRMPERTLISRVEVRPSRPKKD